MIAFIIISSVVLYAFIGVVVYHVWLETAKKRCDSRYHGYCDHEFVAIFECLLWPIVPFVTGVVYIVYIVGKSVSDKISGIVKEKV